MAKPADRPSDRLFAALSIAVAGAVILALRLPYAAIDWFNLDECISMTLGGSILDGGVLYVDAWEHRAPLLYFLHAPVQFLFGRYNLYAMHLFAALWLVATAAIVYWIGKRIGGRSAGAAGGLCFALYSTHLAPLDFMSSNIELFMVLFLSLNVLLFLAAMERDKLLCFFLSGLALGFAVMTKHPAGLNLPAIALVLVAARRFRRDCLAPLGMLAAGTAVPFLLFLAYFALHGALQEFLFSFWTYNMDFYVKDVTIVHQINAVWSLWLRAFRAYPSAVVIALGGTVLVAIDAFAKFFRWGREPVDLLLPWLLVSVAATGLSGRVFDHYMFQVVPAISLLSGLFIVRILQALRAGGSRGLTVTVGLCLALALVLPVVQFALRGAPGIRFPGPYGTYKKGMEAVAAHIRGETTKDDTLFVWGFQPEIYFLSQRRPASRYVFCQPLVGYVTAWKQPARAKDRAIVADAWDALMADLTASRPALIIDTGPSGWWGWQAYPPGKYPPLRRFLQEYYHPPETRTYSVETTHKAPQGTTRTVEIKYALYRRKDAS